MCRELLHDGMNLVAKEFVTARDDEGGSLILSEFTGAARDLPDAILVNPFDVKQMTAALHQSLTMPAEEQRRRIRKMRAQVSDYNIFRWAGMLLSEVGRQNNLEVPQDELTRAVIAEARRYPGQEKQVIEFYQRSPEALNQLRAPLYEEKVVDFILEQANVNDRSVTPEQFAKEGEEELAALKK